MMKRIMECEKICSGATFEKALDKFQKAYSIDESEQFIWMHEIDCESFCDNVMSDGSYNPDWNVAYHLYHIDGNRYYFCYILREEVEA